MYMRIHTYKASVRTPNSVSVALYYSGRQAGKGRHRQAQAGADRQTDRHRQAQANTDRHRNAQAGRQAGRHMVTKYYEKTQYSKYSL